MARSRWKRIAPLDPARYDLVLMDVQMPVMDRCTRHPAHPCAEGPRRAPPSRSVAMTANVFEEERKRAFDCGMNGLLSEPIVIEELIDALKDIMH